MANKLFNRFYKLLSVIAIGCIITPIVYLFFYRIMPKSWVFWIYVLGFTFIGIGYGMQAVYGTITAPRHRARANYQNDDAYEAYDNPFQPLKAALPIIIAAVIALISFGVINGFLFAAYKAGIIATYGSQSLYPVVGAVLVFIFLFAGIVLWFFPAHRIISLRTMFSYFGAMAVVFAASVMLSVPTTMLSISLIIFFACSFIVLNQSYIQRGVTGTVTAISNEGRIYNIKLMIVASAVVAFMLLIFAIVLTGVSFLLKFPLYYIAIRYFGFGKTPSNDNYYDVSDAEVDFSDVLLKNQPVGDQIMIILCILLFIAAIIFFIFRGHAATKRLITKIQQWLRELFLFFMNVRNFGGFGTDVTHEYANYQDEQINLQNASIRQYNPDSGEKRLYRDFLQQLNSLDTATEQIRYAYVTMISVFRSLGYGVRPSETPRETKQRVHARSAENNITDITKAIEAVDYVEVEPSEKECENVIRSMCRIIEKHYK